MGAGVERRVPAGGSKERWVRLRLWRVSVLGGLGRPKTTEHYFLTVLEARSLKPRCQLRGSFWRLRRRLLPCLFQFLVRPPTLGVPQLVDASLQSLSWLHLQRLYFQIKSDSQGPGFKTGTYLLTYDSAHYTWSPCPRASHFRFLVGKPRWVWTAQEVVHLAAP